MYSTQYFDVDTYELERGVDNGSLARPTSPTYQTAPPPEASSVGAENHADSINDAVDGILGEGQAAMVAGRYDDARRLFSQAMFLDDHDGRAKLLFALASLGQGEVELAGLALRRALLTTPELIENPWDLRTLFPTGESGLPDQRAFQRQLDELERYLSDHKDRGVKPAGYAGAQLLLGYLHFGWGDARSAHAIFTELALDDQQSHRSGSRDGLAIRLRDSAARIMSRAGR